MTDRQQQGSSGPERLSWLTRLSFGSGDLLGGGVMTLVGIYYLHFLTDMVRLSPALAGVAILVSKGWDAVSDPLMGTITDRTRTRFGRRRPYFLAGIPLVFISVVALFYPADLSTEMGRFAFALGSYLFFSSVLTMVLIPYYALAPELALEYNQRSQLMAIRLVFATVGSMATSIVPLLIIHNVQSVHTAYLIIGLVFGTVFALPYLAVFLFTRERTEFQQRPRSFSFKRNFVDPMRNRSFRMVLVMYLFTLVATDLILAIAMYFMTYWLQLGEATSLAVGSILVVQVVAVPGYFYLSKRIGKRNTFIVSAVIWVTSLLSSLALRPGDTAVMWVMVFGGFVGAGTSGMLTMVWSLFADVPDVDELDSGLRREGVFSGIFTFARKASSAIGLFIVSVVLEFAGFQSPSQDMVDGVRTIVVQQQSPAFMLALRLAFAFLPVLLIGVAIAAALRFPLTAELHARLNRYLTRRRRGDRLEEADEKEADELHSILVGPGPRGTGPGGPTT